MEKNEKLKELLLDLNENSLLDVWNEYCDKNSYVDDRIYNMWEFDDLFSNLTPLEIVELTDNDFNANNCYFIQGIYGCKSFDYIDENYVYIDDLADYIINNDDDLSNDDIRDFLDEQEEENDIIIMSNKKKTKGDFNYE